MDKLIRGLSLLLFCTFPIFLYAHDSSDTPLANGFTWLHEQQQADGAFSSANDLVLPFAASYESALAFANSNQLEHIDTAGLSTFVANQAPTTTEGLVRSISLKLKLGETIDAEIDSLLEHQNADGGFGDHRGFDSTVYDSVFALQGLALTQYRNAPESGRVINYLLSQQSEDGGFALDQGAPSSSYITSLALRALQPYLYTYNIGEVMTAAREFLFAQVATGSDWPSDWEAAQFLLSVIPLTTDVSRYQSSLTWLITQQQENGSWQGDVFSTALAVQALYLADNITLPTAPDAAVIRGKLIDGSTAQPLVGISIGIEPSPGDSVLTDPNGEFLVQGLQPNSYTLTYAADGYLTATQTFEVRAAQLLDLGSIGLTLVPTTALIRGIVTDATAGAPVIGATVEAVTANGSVQALTDVNGLYSLVVEQGSTVLYVSAAGYQTLSATATVGAGTSVSFSPSLYLDSEEPPPLSLVGRVLDQTTLAPISAATISQVGSAISVSSDNDGRFELIGLTAGEQSFEINATGYQTVAVSLVLPENGAADMGEIQLAPIEEVDSSRVSGRVVDADTGAGIAGATVAVDGFSAQSDQNGFYSIDGITSLEFVVGANAAGYVYGSSQVTLSAPKNLNVDVTLLRADIAGLSLDAVATENPEYDAYQRVNFMATLSNQTVRERYVRLYVLIQDAQGQTIERFPAKDVPAPADLTDPEAIAHYEEHLAESVEVLAPNETRVVSVEQGWNTGIQVPGNYQVVIQALDGSTSQVISEKSSGFVINATQKVSSVTAQATPSFALMNSSPEIAIQALVRNGSNVATEFELGFEIRSPMGTLLLDGIQPVSIVPAEETKTIVLGTLSHTFIESGNYQVTLSTPSGLEPEALLGAQLFVPPTVRLTVEQEIVPEAVIPGAEREIEVQIQVKGVDGE